MSQSNSNIYRLYRWANDRIFASLLHSVQRAADSRELNAERYPLNAKILNCRVQLTRPRTNCRYPPSGPGMGGAISAGDAFTIQIAGSIHAGCDNDCAAVRVLITDVTSGNHKAKPVHTRATSASGGTVFCYQADLGRLPSKVTTLSNWTTVANINLDWLLFPHKGRRILQFNISVLSVQRGQELACAQCLFTYENPAFGYVDLQQNAHRAKTLAVALAFATSAADNKLYHTEVQVIKDWAKANLLPNSKFEILNSKLEEALDQAVCFFQQGNQLDTHKLCKEIVEIAPVYDRYDILELCLRVARAKGFVEASELAILKNMASWLEVDKDRFGAMMEKILPVNLHQVKDAEVILGLDPGAPEDRTRQQLNKQYRKWNSRVTNADPEIQAQADQMLQLIAEARSQYVG